MKMKTLVVALSLLCVSLPGFAEEFLSGEQIKTLLSNKTSEIEKVDKDSKNHLKAYTAKDGSRLLYIPWKDKTVERKWWVEDNKLCGSHPKTGDYCRDVKSVGNGVYHVFSNGKHLRTFKNLKEGNQL